MPNEGSANTAAAILKIAGTINPIIALVGTLFAGYREMRAAAIAANPALAAELPTERKMIETFLEKAGLFKSENAELRAWAQTLVDARTPPSP